MAPRLKIGNWVRRKDPDPELEKWHYIESIVADAAITTCGKRMEPDVDGLPLEFTDTMPLTRMIGQPQLCDAGCPK